MTLILAWPSLHCWSQARPFTCCLWGYCKKLSDIKFVFFRISSKIYSHCTPKKPNKYVICSSFWNIWCDTWWYHPAFSGIWTELEPNQMKIRISWFCIINGWLLNQSAAIRISRKRLCVACLSANLCFLLSVFFFVHLCPSLSFIVHLSPSLSIYIS